MTVDIGETAELVARATYSDGRVVQGVVKEKQRARQDYQSAVQAGQQANLLERMAAEQVNVAKAGFDPMVKSDWDYQW